MADEYDDDFETVDDDTVTNISLPSALPSNKSIPTDTNERSLQPSMVTTTTKNQLPTSLSPSTVPSSPPLVSPGGRAKSSNISSSSSSAMNASLITERQQALSKGIREGYFIHNAVQTVIDNHHQSIQCDTTEYSSMGLQIPDDLGIPNAKIGMINSVLSPSSVMLPSTTSSSSASSSSSVSKSKERTVVNKSSSSSTNGTANNASNSSSAPLSNASVSIDSLVTDNASKERLLNFIDKSSKVMEIILEDNLFCYHNQHRNVARSPSSSASLVSYHSSVKMVQPQETDIEVPKIPLLAGRTITAIASSYQNNYDIAIAFSSMDTSTIIPILFRSGISILPQYREASIILLLSTIDNSIQKVFVCWPNSSLTALSFSTMNDSNVLIGGSRSGALYAWNMDDPVWLHSTIYGTGITMVTANTSSRNSNGGKNSSSQSMNLTIDTGLRSPSFSIYNNPNENPQDDTKFSNGGAIVRIVPLDKHVSSSSLFASTNLSSVGRSHFRVGMGLKSFLDDPISNGSGSVGINPSTTASSKQHTYPFAVGQENGTIHIFIVHRLPLPPSGSSIPTTIVQDSKTSSSSSNNSLSSTYTNSSFLPSASTLIALIDERDYGRGVTGTLRMIKSSTIVPASLSPFTAKVRTPSPSSAVASSLGLSSYSSPICTDSDTDSTSSKFLVALRNGYIVVTGYTSNEKLSPSIFYPPTFHDDNLTGLLYQRSQQNTVPVGDGPLSATITNNLYPSTGVQAMCVRFHPHPRLTDIFIAGFSNGLIGLYSIHHALPLSVWSMPNTKAVNSSASDTDDAIIYVAWLMHRPSVFMAVNSTGQLVVYDLSVNAVKPVAHHMINKDNRSTDNIPTTISDKATIVAGNGGSVNNLSQVSVLCGSISNDGANSDPYFFGKLRSLTLPTSFTLPVVRNDDAPENRTDDSVERMLRIIERLR